jgi:TetR/AcrR family transcriptional regulator
MTEPQPASFKTLSPKELLRVESVAKTAATLFDKAGYHETSLKDISSAASLSKGAIYYYFSNKHEILLYILDSYMDLLLNGLDDDLAQFPDSISKLKHILSRHMATFSSHAASARILLKYAHNLPANELAGIVRKQKQYARILAEILADSAGTRLDKDQIKACSYIVFGMYNSIIYWHRPDGPLPLPELTEICCELFLNGWNAFIAKSANKNSKTPS